jgi:hypothetical protein
MFLSANDGSMLWIENEGRMDTEIHFLNGLGKKYP